MHTYCHSVGLSAPPVLLELHLALDSNAATTKPQTLNTRYSPGIIKWQMGLRKSSLEKHICPLHGEIRIPAGKCDRWIRGSTTQNRRVRLVGIIQSLQSGIQMHQQRLKDCNESESRLTWVMLEVWLDPYKAGFKSLLMDFTFHSRFPQVKSKLCFTGAAHAVFVCG